MKNELIYQKIYEMLVSANEKFNLTRITDYDDFITKHVKDSMLGLPLIKGKVLDIGSGAGFPGLVFAVENGSLDVTMLDSVGKKVNYVNTVISALGLKNARAIHSRVEDLPDKGAFDTVTARAVARLNVLAEYALPFVKIGGAFIAYKSGDSEEEINEAKYAIKILGGKIERVMEEVLDEQTVRKIIVVRKISRSPALYPRKGNKSRLNPLIAK